MVLGTGQRHANGGSEITNGSYHGRRIVPNMARAGTVYYLASTPARVFLLNRYIDTVRLTVQ
jgi:hypothetical protein